MQIKKITYKGASNDFKWIGECEHCKRVTAEIWGYNDSHYMTKVIPSVECKGCGNSTTKDFKDLVTVETH